MKTIKAFILPLMLVLCTFIYSCQNAGENKKENPKEVAEDANENKFTDEAEKDADVMVAAYSKGLFEVAFANQAKSRAVTQDVKDLAAMLSSAHEKLNGQIKDLAATKQITLPTELTKEQKDDLDDAFKKEGIKYDNHFVDEMIEKHKRSIEKFEKASEKGQDADIRNLFASALPELRNHLDMAQKVKDKVKDMK